ncbi:MAG TPA: glycosyltransferase [Candidatus Ozemobacteraceae bacterium]|nr:glycosyltransferase [Candidatus Ozemobacteraceae bacterium]HQG27077.1 glycosyltransferase [Candidatus Ozemobacteraceae bacterium]
MTGRLAGGILQLLQSGKRPAWLELLLSVDGSLAFSCWLAQQTLASLLALRGTRPPPPADRKRLLFLTNERFSLPAARIRCADMAWYLREAGFEADVFSYGERYFAGQPGFYTRLSDTQKMLANLRATWDLRNEAGTVLIVQRTHYHALAALALRRRLGARIVLDLDDFDWKGNPNGFKWLCRFPPFRYDTLFQTLVKLADGCIVSSHRLFELVSPHHPNTILIPTGVRPDRFPAHPHRDAPDVCFSWVGTLMHRENLNTLNLLIDQFLAIPSPVPKRLQIVGGGTWFGELKKRAAAHPEITILDWVHPDRISELMRGVDVGLFPLFEDTEFSRCKSPTKMFEYMASRRAVIVSDLGEASRIIRHGRNGLLARRPDEFGALMKQLLEHPDLRRTLADRGLETILSEYQLPHLAARLARFLSKL